MAGSISLVHHFSSAIRSTADCRCTQRLSTPAKSCGRGFVITRAQIRTTFAEWTKQHSSSTSGKFMVKVSDFMTKKEDMHVMKPSTPVDEALKALVEKGLSGFPVIDDHWNLVGIVSDYDLLALALLPDEKANTNLFPDVDSSWKTFHALQKLLCKSNGTVVGDVMTSDPLTVYDTTTLEIATRMMLETKFVRLPVVNAEGILVGVITRDNVMRAACHTKAISKKLP